MTIPLVLALTLAWFGTDAGFPGATWSQWRGHGRDGVWHENRLRLTFSEAKLRPRWVKPLGGGYAGIAVADGAVFTLDRQTTPREVERVVCLEAATGKERWVWEYPVKYNKMDYGNGPRSTPTVQGGRVFTFGAVGHLHCLDARLGKVLWSHDTVKELKGRIPTWGHSCSPLLDGSHLIVQVGGEPNASLVAFERETGKEVWRALSDRPGYSSPVAIRTAAGSQIVYWTPENLAGIEPETGSVRWRVPWTSSYDVSICDPVWHNGILLVSGYWEGSLAIRLDAAADNPKILWKGKQLSCLMSTPLVSDGLVYGLDRHDGLKCLELETGRVRWHGFHITPKGRNPHASLVWVSDASGSRALILNELGELINARLSGKEYRLLSRSSIFEGSWAHPAFAYGCLFVRNDKEIRCVPLIGN